MVKYLYENSWRKIFASESTKTLDAHNIFFYNVNVSAWGEEATIME